jgi:hypothetical protein
VNDPATSTKDRFFEQLAAISNEMVGAHGRDFAIGTLVLAARYIAENAPTAEPAPSEAGADAQAASA